MDKNKLKEFLSWRNIDPEFDTICKKCNGSGTIAYADTSTWSKSIAGQMITFDVCDKCWGSGRTNAPWTNLRIHLKR